MRRAAFACCIALALAPVAASAQQADPLATLSAEQRAFLSDPATLERFGLTPEKLALALAGKTAAERSAYADALIAVVADARFKAGRDTAEILLNQQARGWNASSTVRPKFLDKRTRDDGPFSLKRYVSQRGGIPTFADAPIALRPADLIAGKVEVAFVGVPLDLSSGWRDAKHAPVALRAMDGLVGAEADSGVDPGLVLALADYGDLSVDNMAAERSIDHVRQMIGEVAKTGAVPFVIGGDHTIMFPDVAAAADTYGAETLALVQFDAHPEADEGSDHSISDRQSLTRLIEQRLIDPRNVTQIGLRGRDADAATLARLAKAGVGLHPMKAITERGATAVADDVVARLKRGPANVFVSFDMSVLDPAAAAAAGRPVPGGLTIREAVPMLRRVCRETNVVGFDLLDVAPILDPTYVSTLSANTILHACLAGIAERKVSRTGGVR